MKPYHKIQTVYLRDPETNYKNLLEGVFSYPEFEYLADCEWEFTEKVDGTNVRVMWENETLTFGGRTDNAQMQTNLLRHLQQTFLPELFLHKFGSGPVCLYGEGYGAGIQKGGGNYNPSGCGFALFDVLVGDWWLKSEDVTDIARHFNIMAAPIIGFGTLYQMVDIARLGFNSFWGPFTAEGIVARPTVPLLNRGGSRIITKIKHKDFL